MSTYEQSKIKTARKDWQCHRCRCVVRKGQQYFSYQVGQRSSYGYCLTCMKGGNCPDGATSIYVAKYVGEAAAMLQEVCAEEDSSR